MDETPGITFDGELVIHNIWDDDYKEWFDSFFTPDYFNRHKSCGWKVSTFEEKKRLMNEYIHYLWNKYGKPYVSVQGKPMPDYHPRKGDSIKKLPNGKFVVSTKVDKLRALECSTHARQTIYEKRAKNKAKKAAMEEKMRKERDKLIAACREAKSEVEADFNFAYTWTKCQQIKKAREAPSVHPRKLTRMQARYGPPTMEQIIADNLRKRRAEKNARRRVQQAIKQKEEMDLAAAMAHLSVLDLEEKLQESRKSDLHVTPQAGFTSWATPNAQRIKEMVYSIVPPGDIVVLDTIAKAIAWVHLCYTSQSWTQVAEATFLYLDGINGILDKTALLEIFANNFKSEISSLVVQQESEFDKEWINESPWVNAGDIPVTPQALSDTILKIASSAKGIIKGPLATSIRTIVMSVISLRLFNVDLGRKIMSFVGYVPKMSFLECIETIFLQLYTLLKCGEMIKDGADAYSVLTSTDPIRDCTRQIEKLLLYKDKVYSGLPVEGYLPIEDFVVQGEALSRTAIVLLKKASIFETSGFALTKLNTDLTSVLTDMKNKILGTDRPVPFGIILHGHPGIGKSTILNLIAEMWSKVRGREFSPAQIYARVMTSEYWEGYNPMEHPFVHYSEAGNMAERFVASHGDPGVMEITSVMDGLPMLANMAAVEFKGKVYIRPEVMLIDSNNPDMNARVLLKNAAALMRRFTFVEPVVKPEFRIPGRMGLDSAKSLAGGNIYDRWYFRVTKRIPTSVSEYEEIVLMAGTEEDNIFKLTEVLSAKMVEHILSQEKLLNETRGRVHATEVLAHTATLSKPVDNVEEKKSDLSDRVEPMIPVASLSVTPQSQLLDKAKVCWNVSKAYISESMDNLSNRYYMTSRSVMNTCTGMALALMFISQGFVATMLLKLFKEQIHSKAKRAVHTLAILITVVVFFLSHLLFVIILFMGFGIPILPTCIVSTIVSVTISCVVYISSFVILHTEVMKFLDRGTSMQERGIAYLRYYTGMTRNYWEVSWSRYSQILIIGATFFSLGFAAVYIKRYASKKLAQVFESEPQASTDGDYLPELSEIEETVQASRSYSRVPVKNHHQIWNNIIPFTNTNGSLHAIKDVERTILHNVRRIHNLTNNSKAFGVGVFQDYMLVNDHVLDGDNVQLAVAKCAYFIHNVIEWTPTFQISRKDKVVITGDTALIRVRGARFKDLRHLFGLDVNDKNTMAGRIGERDVTVTRVIAPHKFKNLSGRNSVVTEALHYEYRGHGAGLCGLPLIVSLGGKSVVAGIHFSNVKNDTCAATIIYREELDDAIQQMRMLTPFIPVVSEADVYDPTLLHLEDPSPKSVIRYEIEKNVTYHGRFPVEVNMPKKSKLRKYPFATSYKDLLLSYFPTHQFKDTFKPLMYPLKQGDTYISPYNNAFRSLAHIKGHCHIPTLERVINELILRFTTMVKQRGVTTLQPLDVQTAINGSMEDAFLRRINVSTSAGFGFGGKKEKHLPLWNGETRQPTIYLQEKIISVLDAYRNGKSASFVYTGCLKDEPRSKAKVEAGKTRMFYANSLESLVVTRMFLAPFYTLMVEHNDIFCTSVGINMHADAHDFITRLTNFSPYLFEGDYKDYDCTIPMDIMLAAKTIIAQFFRNMGYNADAMKITEALLSDQTFPTFSFLADIMTAPSVQPSGKYGTAEDNSLIGLVIMMYVFYRLCPDKEFFKEVLPVTYGDDNLSAISSDIKHIFNVNSFARVLREELNMTFTDSAKSISGMKDYITIDECSFLKRNFVYRKDLRRYVAPLSLDSILKMCTWYEPKETVSVNEQCESTLQSLAYEIFFHLNEYEYERFMSELKHLIAISPIYGVDVNTIPSWNSIRSSVFGDS